MLSLLLAATALSQPLPPLQFNTSFDHIASTWALLRASSPLISQPLAAINASATNALRSPSYSVMNKTRLPPSGDRHDYMSVGVYWWPCSHEGPQTCACPNTTFCVTTSPTCDVSTGLPWVSCDGHFDGPAVASMDEPKLASLAAAVSALAQGFYWTRTEAYAQRAAQLVRTWFLDPATRMNPNLNFGQAFPGVENNGTFSGLIETDGNFIQLLDSVALLQAPAPCGENGASCPGSPAWTPADDAGLRAWLSQWSAWLAGSPFSQQALSMFNNHQTWIRGAWFLVSSWLGDTPRGAALLEGAKGGGPHASICDQIGVGGELPAEEGRVNSIGYVEMDLQGLLNLAGASRYAPFVDSGGAASQVGDLYTFVCPTGNHSSIREAVEYLIPYATGAKAWPYPTETTDFSGAAPLLRQLAVALGNTTLWEIAGSIKGASATDKSLLWWRMAA